MADAAQRGLGPQAIINLEALRHNLQIVRQLAPGSGIVSVIKADAYGHGMLQVARVLSDSDILAVARVSEGVTLRESGIDRPILVLEGFFELSEIKSAIEHRLQITIHHTRQIDMLETLQGLADNALQFWLKVDTGMHRLGMSVEEAHKSLARLQQLRCCSGTPVLMTHFANADDIDTDFTLNQIKAFRDFSAQYDFPLSLANSAGIIAWPESHQQWVRPGIMLYGASPMLGIKGPDHQLQPVMTLKSQLMTINHLKKDDCIGYGSCWCCPEDMPVGVVAIGYGDGYPRHAPSGTPVLVNGQRTQLIGRVSMDMVTVDLRGIEAVEGDDVILWGKGLAAEEIAESAGTISYELFCGVTSRVRFEYRG
ncbi:MAG: alanine racemase [Gammaproteobacteria bacterium]|nr:alanine racemase [Gammaproteobacteria bacterium]